MKQLFYIFLTLFPTLIFASSPCLVEAKYPFEKELQLHSGAFIGEVVAIKPLSKQVHGSVVQYETTINVLHTLKGTLPRIVFLKFDEIYLNPLKKDQMVLLGGLGIKTGEKFVVFQKALNSMEFKACDRFVRPMHLVPKKYQIDD